MAWSTNKPADSDFLRDVAKQWREDKTSFTTFFNSFVLTSTSSAGYPVDTGRILVVDQQSQVSSRGRTDLIYNTEDDELIYLDSNGSQVRIGGAHAIHSVLTLDSENNPSMAMDCKTVIEYGSETTTNGNILRAHVNFNRTYAVPPAVFICSSSTQPGVSSAASFIVGINGLDTSGFTCMAQFVTPTSTNTVNDILWRWRSVGTVAL